MNNTIKKLGIGALALGLSACYAPENNTKAELVQFNGDSFKAEGIISQIGDYSGRTTGTITVLFENGTCGTMNYSSSQEQFTFDLAQLKEAKEKKEPVTITGNDTYTTGCVKTKKINF